MATAWELKQQQYAKAAQERKLVRGVTGSVTQVGVKASLNQALKAGGGRAVVAEQIGAAGVVATIINLAGAIGIGAWQYFSGKKQLKKQERLTRKQANTTQNIDDILTEINEVGNIVVQEHGIDPTTAEFEKILYDNLFKSIGYRGNCNITAWVPGSEGDPKPIWFKVTQNGRVFEPVSIDGVPPNIQTHWFVNCNNLKDGWAKTYRDLLIKQGRVRELEAFEATRKRGVLVLRITFGLAFAILIFLVVKYGMAIK